MSVATLPAPASTGLRLNLGCGAFPLEGWQNIDALPGCTDVAHTYDVRQGLRELDGTVDEVYCGHLLEHLTPEEAQALLAECARVLRPGGRLGVVVPDTRAIMQAYLSRRGVRCEMPQGVFWNLDALDDVCAIFLFSTYQDSPHRWAYDQVTLGLVLLRAGFLLTGPIDRLHDPRIPVGAWYQCGWDAITPEREDADARDARERYLRDLLSLQSDRAGNRRE
jgi:SAM-dependent methyltransferase